MSASLPSDEPLYDIRPRDPLHLIELAWHLGNRHLPAEIRQDRILILRDPVIKAMLEGLGATVAEVTEPFQPMRGAYHGSAGTTTDIPTDMAAIITPMTEQADTQALLRL